MIRLCITFLMMCGILAFVDNDDHVATDSRKDRISRNRRNAGISEQAQGLQQQGLPFMMSPNLQASYFLGQCVMCPPGDPGPRGVQGPQGVPGRDGRDQIIIGPIGEHTIQPPPTSALDGGSSSSSGVTYTRWGKTTCPNTAQLVYQGIMGSSNDYTQKGSGVNYLCMPLEPAFADPPSRGNGAYIFGVEYQHSLLPSRDLVESEASCAVCLAPAKETVIVVPGTNACLGTQDWTLEYHGYLMSSHASHFKSEFVCIDLEAEGVPRTNHNNNEALLYIADAKCSASGGGLPCPPYADGNDILCAVCTL